MNAVDVIVPCYRYGHFLRQCVESVLAQREIKVRVLILDDASPDCTAEVARQLISEDRRVTFVRHASNKGHIATYNEGIEWTSSEYYMILSADDYLLPGALANVGRFMDAHPHVGLAYSRAITLDERGNTSPASMGQSKRGEWEVLLGSEFIERTGAQNIVPTPTAVVRTRLQKQVGGYLAALPHTGDYEMWLRLAAHSSVGVSNDYHAVYRRHARNMSLAYTAGGCLNDLHQRKNAFDCFIHVCCDLLPNPENMHRRFSRLLAVEAVALASGAFNEGEMKVSEQLSALAIQLYPQVKRSPAWTRLTCKRLAGRRMWRMLHPIVSRTRRACSSLSV